MSQQIEDIERAMNSSPDVKKLLAQAEIAIENQTKLADAATIAATAFNRLVIAIEKGIESQLPSKTVDK